MRRTVEHGDCHNFPQGIKPARSKIWSHGKQEAEQRELIDYFRKIRPARKLVQGRTSPLLRVLALAVFWRPPEFEVGEETVGPHAAGVPAIAAPGG